MVRNDGEDDRRRAEAGSPFESVPFSLATGLIGARDALPAYMLPSVVVGVDEWPRTSSGKIDRWRLPAAFFADADKDHRNFGRFITS